MYLQVKLERKLREKNNENRYINKMKKKKAKIHKKITKCAKDDTTVCSAVGTRPQINS